MGWLVGSGVGGGWLQVVGAAAQSDYIDYIDFVLK